MVRSTKVDYINRLRKNQFLEGKEVIRVRKEIKKSVVLCYEHEAVKEKNLLGDI